MTVSGTKPGTSHYRSSRGQRPQKEEALDDLLSKDKKGPSSIGPILELFNVGEKEKKKRRRLLRIGMERIIYYGFSERMFIYHLRTELN